MARAKAMVGDLRRVNRSVVLRRLFLEGPLNRVDLGQFLLAAPVSPISRRPCWTRA